VGSCYEEARVIEGAGVLSTEALPLVLAPAQDSVHAAFGVGAQAPSSYGPYLRAKTIHCGTLKHTDSLRAPWHRHDLHQIEYSVDGVVEIQTLDERYVLAPQHAAWIPAGVTHRAVMHRATAMSIFLDPELLSADDELSRVIVLPSLLLEMAEYAVRWPIYRSISDPRADTFFESVAYLVAEVLQGPAAPAEPRPDPAVRAVMAHTQANLKTVSLSEVCRVVGTSERTLRRIFMASTGRTWREYLTHSRVEAAQAILRTSDRTVADVAHTVGFDSVSAFTRAYVRFFDEPPAAFRKT
jgi:AraC-like DNA-binding protein